MSSSCYGYYFVCVCVSSCDIWCLSHKLVLHLTLPSYASCHFAREKLFYFSKWKCTTSSNLSSFCKRKKEKFFITLLSVSLPFLSSKEKIYTYNCRFSYFYIFPFSLFLLINGTSYDWWNCEWHAFVLWLFTLLLVLLLCHFYTWLIHLSFKMTFTSSFYLFLFFFSSFLFSLFFFTLTNLFTFTLFCSSLGWPWTKQQQTYSSCS